MSLPVPLLDDLDWSELVEEARFRIPSTAPGWTDHNIHDPGITIAELLAWLTEQTGYRLDQVPDRHRRRFLALIGQVPAPATPARAVLRCTTDGPTVPIPEGTTVEADSEVDGAAPIPFTVTRAGWAGPAQLVELTGGAGGRRLTVDGTTPVAALGDEGTAPLTLRLAPGAAGHLTVRFEVVVPAGAVLAPLEPTDTADGTAGLTDAAGCPPGPSDPPVTLGWEVEIDGTWVSLGDGDVTDRTRALTRSGSVEYALPAGTVTGIRARVTGGRYDRAPELTAVTVNAVEIAQIVRRTDTFDAPEGLRRDLASTGIQRLELRSTGPAGGADPAAPPAAGVEPPVGWEVVAVPPRRPTDPVAVFAPSTGIVDWSNGRWGRRPFPGERFTATITDSSGPAGNLRPGAATFRIVDPDPGSVTVDAPLGATGGAPAETPAEAMAAAARRLWAHERLVELVEASGGTSLDDVAAGAVAATEPPARAVTALDLERLALASPEVRLARVRAFPELDLAVPCAPAPGTVSLVVLPHLPTGRPGPTTRTLAAVRAQLRAAKTIGTRILVAGPDYVEVAIGVGVAVPDGVDPERARARVAAAVRGFLDPLTGGPDGRGWPFGRDLYRTEIMAAAAAVDGVRLVTSVALAPAGAAPSACANLCVPPTSLVAVVTVDVEVTTEAGS